MHAVKHYIGMIQSQTLKAILLFKRPKQNKTTHCLEQSTIVLKCRNIFTGKERISILAGTLCISAHYTWKGLEIINTPVANALTAIGTFQCQVFNDTSVVCVW